MLSRTCHSLVWGLHRVASQWHFSMRYPEDGTTRVLDYRYFSSRFHGTSPCTNNSFQRRNFVTKGSVSVGVWYSRTCQYYAVVRKGKRLFHVVHS
ncbi:hypothetical protein GQ44DRAFT_293694 [Phaeosphaeriaceae sp. PMI808]|nr:hypothetical protein GQ44DRAFT_293694 [Phaeosphaeriaceae sp. PMI808]